MAKLTNEEIQAKADELSKELNAKVTPIVFEEETDSELQIVGYLKEPSMIVKLRMLDKSVIGAYSAASEALDICLVKEASDPRISSGRPEDEAYYLGAVMEIYKKVQFATNTFKKK